ncbi:MAG TPA: DUF488 family protein [Verrucomicrobiae bacterium]|nr:DUF488 family protein [Verrucomicrobiae bacterium]
MKKAKPEIQIKRVYEPAAETDGKRFLVDRLWPRGISKESLRLAGWLKDIAPGDGLRRWFGHSPRKWNGFQKRYQAELAAAPDRWHPLIEAATEGKVTLLFSARDLEQNNAVVLKRFLEEKLKR